MQIQARLQEVPHSPFGFVCREFSRLLDTSMSQSRGYYEKFDWSRNPKQQMLYDLLRNPPTHKVQHVLLRGSVGSGKSTAAIAWIYEILDHFPGAKALGMRRTHGQLIASLYQQILEFNRDFNIPSEKKESKTSGPPEIRYPNGSKWVFWSSESAVETTKTDTARGLGGTQYSVALLEEADMVHEEAVDTIPQRLREKSGVDVRVIFYNANPTPESHWLHKKFKEKNVPDPENYHELHFTMEDNKHWLPPGYIESARDACKNKPALYRRMILGEWGPEIKGKPLYGPHFDRNFHIAKNSFIERWQRDQLWKDGPLMMGWDFGFRHPAVTLFQDVQIGSFRQIRVLLSELGDNITIRIFGKYVIDKIHQLFPNAEILSACDPAGKVKDARGVTDETAIDVLKSLGLNPVFRKSDIIYGVDLTIQLLQSTINHPLLGVQPEIVLEPDQRYTGDLLAMLELGYCQDPNSGDFKPYDDDYYIHIADSLRYGLIHRRRLKGNRTQLDRARENYQALNRMQNGLYIADPNALAFETGEQFASYNFGGMD